MKTPWLPFQIPHGAAAVQLPWSDPPVSVNITSFSAKKGFSELMTLFHYLARRMEKL